MNKLVDLPTAKLLKQKGFNEPCFYHYYIDGSITETYNYNIYNKLKNSNIKEEQSAFELEIKCSAPTIAEVAMWLYEKYGIWIEGQHCGTFNEFNFKISKLNKKNIKKEPHYMHDFGKGYNSPTEAYEAAIEYCLTKLI